MIVLVIGASEEAIYAIELARNMGHYVIALDGNKNAKGLSYANEAGIIDISDPENIYKYLGERKVDMVLPTPVGRLLYVIGKVNDHYGLKGVSAYSANICTDKYLFHEIMVKEGLRKAKCKLVESKEDLENWNVFPAILKPRFGAGSRNVFALKTKEEFDNLEVDFCEEYVIETMAKGVEYGMDGICIDGCTKLILLRKKLLTPLPARQCVGYMSVEQELWQEYTDKISTMMKTIGIKDGVFHGDLIIMGDEVFPIEISARPSGHRLHNIFTPLASGVSELREYLKAINGEKVDFSKHNVKKQMIRYFDFEDCVIEEVPEEQYICSKYPVILYECNIKPGDIMNKVIDGHSVMGRGYFIVEAKDDEELIEISNKVLVEFALRTD